MTDNTQPEALRLADALEGNARTAWTREEAAAELRRQHARIAELEAQLSAIGAGGVEPLRPRQCLHGIGHEGVYAMTMREEQREAWRRKGWNTEPLFAAPQPVAREPSGHIKEPYTLAEIKAKIASNDYSAEMLLQHAMLLLDSASLSANAGEPRNAIDRDALIDAIAQCLHGTWHCTRVWESWHVGTMSQDDFEPVDESETPTEIADAVLALLAAPGPADGERAIGEKMVLDPCCGSLVFMKP